MSGHWHFLPHTKHKRANQPTATHITKTNIPRPHPTATQSPTPPLGPAHTPALAGQGGGPEAAAGCGGQLCARGSGHQAHHRGRGCGARGLPGAAQPGARPHDVSQCQGGTALLLGRGWGRPALGGWGVTTAMHGVPLSVLPHCATLLYYSADPGCSTGLHVLHVHVQAARPGGGGCRGRCL